MASKVASHPATPSPPAAADLSEDRLTSWAPDVAADAELAYLDPRAAHGCGPEVRPLRVPLPGGGQMTVPVIHPALLVALHDATRALRERADDLLAEGVHGYRYGAREGWHYAPAWRTFSDETAARASEARWVAFTDVAAFFASTTWPMTTHALQRVGGPGAAEDLGPVIARFRAAAIGCLPSGYSDARFLSNLVLAQPDRAIGIPFLRWVDDYRIFADTRAEARGALQRLHAALEQAGLQANMAKTRIVPAHEAAKHHRNTLASVYHPDRDPPETVRANLHRVFAAAAAEPVARRRELRFSLSRLAREADPAAVDWALLALRELPWEAPRVVSYLSRFAGNPRLSGVDRMLRAAARERDEWMLARLIPLAWHTPISTETASALARSVQDLHGSPAWGLALRAASHAGDTRVVGEALAGPVPDHRALLVTLADLGWQAPRWLCDCEPALAAALADGPAPPPPVESLL